MINTIREILIVLTAITMIFGKALPVSTSITGKAGNNSDIDAGHGQGEEETLDRLPFLLRDVKMLLTDALIADVNDDTLEVIYTLDRINDLLTEADQLGEMTEDDREEFDRFENAYVEIYVSRFNTLDKTDAALTAEKLRKDVTGFIEPLVVEMGSSQFTVVDDRDGHVPLVRNKKVDQFIEFFRTKGRRQFEIWLERYDYYGPVIKKIIAENGLPDNLIYLAMIESGFNPRAYSRANAAGMWQFIYSTGKMYGLQRSWYVDERRDPVKATNAACAYIKDLYEEFDSWYLALAAYNVGSGRMHRAIRLHQTTDFWQLHSLPRETRNYIPYFLAASIIANDPQE
ncbi:MAG: lytic transglycosylase domain-containing protein [Candidatus Neomarinimicrobiota bacterium]